MLFGPKLRKAELKNGREFFIEEHNKCAYLYVTNERRHHIFAKCWLANYCKAPIEKDIKSMEKGMQPRMHISACAIPEGIAPIKNFEFKWIDEQSFAVMVEGKAVALIRNAFTDNVECYSKFITEETYGTKPLKI